MPPQTRIPPGTNLIDMDALKTRQSLVAPEMRKVNFDSMETSGYSSPSRAAQPRMTVIPKTIDMGNLKNIRSSKSVKINPESLEFIHR